jgi:hypothetical protein
MHRTPFRPSPIQPLLDWRERNPQLIITSEQFKHILAAGGGFVIDASTMTFNQIKEIAPAANANKAGITLKNVSGMTSGQLAEIAALAPGLIVFDLTG